MTTFDDETVVDLRDAAVRVGTAPSVERRGPATAPRVSWASPTPFVLPVVPAQSGGAIDAFDPITRAELRRRAWARPLVLRALTGDAVVAALVWFGAFASFGGGALRLALGA